MTLMGLLVFALVCVLAFYILRQMGADKIIYLIVGVILIIALLAWSGVLGPLNTQIR